MSENEPISGSSRDYGSTAPPAVTFADFSPTELYNLSESIATNVNSINSSLRSLEKKMKQIGGNNDNVPFREKIHTTQQTVNASISATARDLQRLDVLARRGDKPQKLQVERLTSAFKDALDKYTTVQKQVTEKMKAHMPKSSRQVMDPNLMESQAIADDEEATLIANQQTQVQAAQFETSMLLEKEAYISKIEADVMDVNQIMQNLAEMVSAQAQTVDSVETHIESATTNVEAGVDELAKAAEYQRRYRRIKYILILIGLIIAILIIVFIVRSFR